MLVNFQFTVLNFKDYGISMWQQAIKPFLMLILIKMKKLLCIARLCDGFSHLHSFMFLQAYPHLTQEANPWGLYHLGSLQGCIPTGFCQKEALT